MPSHEEIERKVSELSALPVDDPKTVEAIRDYLSSLPPEDAIYATTLGANIADAQMKDAFGKWQY